MFDLPLHSFGRHCFGLELVLDALLSSSWCWIGVGVGRHSWLKKYAMQQVSKTLMSQMGSRNNQFSNAAFPSGSPFGFPSLSVSGPGIFPGFPYQPPSPSGPSTSSATAGYAYNPPSTSRPGKTNAAPSSTAQPEAARSSPPASVTMDVSAKTPEVTEPVLNDEAEIKADAKQSAFVDVAPEETLQTSPFENYDDASSWRSSEAAKFTEIVQNGAVPKEGTTSESSQETNICPRR